MLFRGNTPLTPAETAVYEIELAISRWFTEQESAGLWFVKRIDPTGPVWDKTLRGMQEFDCPLRCSGL